MSNMVIVTLAKYTLVLTPQEIEQAVIKNPALWKEATRRGKGYIRTERSYNARGSGKHDNTKL